MKLIYNDDDSDMKIVGESPSQHISSSRDSDSSGAIEEQKENGNISRARQLGATIAGEVEEESSKLNDTVFYMQEPIDELMTMRRLLMIFSIVSTIESRLDNKYVMRTALNVFYDILKKENPRIYDLMSSSGASTFYYLAIRRGGDSAQNVGSAFAMLCEKDGDEDVIRVGTQIFSYYRAKTIDLIESMRFVK